MCGKRSSAVLWKLAVGGFVLAVGPCPSVQYPPEHTELFWGIAIARGAETDAASPSSAAVEKSMMEPVVPSEAGTDASETEFLETGVGEVSDKPVAEAGRDQAQRRPASELP